MYLATYIHLLAAVIWLGGMLFLTMVLVPVIRSVQEPPGFSARILGTAARRFRVVAWASLLTLIGTGVWNLLDRGVSPIDVFTGQGRFILLLRLKLGLVGGVLLLSGLHDFVIGPRLARRLESLRGSTSADRSLLRQRSAVSWLARINLALALTILALAVLLVRGTPF